MTREMCTAGVTHAMTCGLQFSPLTSAVNQIAFLKAGRQLRNYEQDAALLFQ